MKNNSLTNLVYKDSKLIKLEKRRPILYSILLLFQLLSLVSNIVIIPASKDPQNYISFEGAMLIDLIVVLLLTVANMFFLYHFIKRKWPFWMMIFLLATSISLNFVNVLLRLQELHFQTFLIIFGITTTISLFVLCFSMYIAVRDIFGEKLKIQESLLGATNIYLLIGSVFAFLYALLNIIMPGSIIPNADISHLYNTCIIESTYILASIDLPSNVELPPAIRNCMLFESIFAHLFAVFIVGRLLAK